MPPAFVDGTEVFAAPNSIYLPVRERDNNNLTFISRIKRENGITRTWKRSVGTIPGPWRSTRQSVAPTKSQYATTLHPSCAAIPQNSLRTQSYIRAAAPTSRQTERRRHSSRRFRAPRVAILNAQRDVMSIVTTTTTVLATMS